MKPDELAAGIAWLIENGHALRQEIDRALFGMTDEEFFEGKN